jgi:DNA-binding NarL/FixJ family response regulator
LDERLNRGADVPGSKQEEQILVAIAGGATNKEIAAQLELSEQAVKWHVSKLLRRYGVGGRAALAALHEREKSSHE